jgi:thioredoxin 1
MKKMKWMLFFGIMLACRAVLPVSAGDSPGAAIPPVPTPGMVTMLDLGADNCVPCKMMTPVIKAVQKEYAGRASIIFIDVWKHHEQVERFGIQAIPTQIFYDKSGQEVARHVGFMDKKSIAETLEKLGVPAEGGP